jgi:hypothetical protein
MGIVDGDGECASWLEGGGCLGLFYLVDVHRFSQGQWHYLIGLSILYVLLRSHTLVTNVG